MSLSVRSSPRATEPNTRMFPPPIERTAASMRGRSERRWQSTVGTRDAHLPPPLAAPPHIQPVPAACRRRSSVRTEGEATPVS